MAPPRGQKRLRRAPRRPRTRSRQCPCSGGAPPRRSIFSSSVSATRAGSTSERGTTWVGSSWTSSRRGTRVVALEVLRAARRVRAREARVSLIKPETFMNESGRSIAAAARFFKVLRRTLLVVHDDVDLEERPAAGTPGRWACWSQRTALDRADARDAGVSPAAHRGRPARAAAIGVRSPTTCCPEFDPATTSAPSSRASADAVETIVREGLEAAQQRFN